MGYRTYIGELSKQKYQEIKDLTLQELKDIYFKDRDEYDWFSPRDIIDKCLFEFGKYADLTDDPYMFDVFTKEDTINHFNSDTELWRVEKDFLKLVIEKYEQKIKDYYNDLVGDFKTFKDDKVAEFNKTFDFNLLTDKQKTTIARFIEHIKQMDYEWDHFKTYDLEKGDEITTSWKYEYTIFELVRIYKTFDWENKIMVYYGL